LQKNKILTIYRYHQKEVMNATLSGKDVFVIMPTGSGKYLLYYFE
jgi:superfamily II DNA helicase RecQ